MIPATGSAAGLSSTADFADYVAKLTLPEGAEHIGQPLANLETLVTKADVALIGLVRNGKRLFGPQVKTTLVAGDALVLVAHPKALDEFRASLGLRVSDNAREAILAKATERLTLI